MQSELTLDKLFFIELRRLQDLTGDIPTVSGKGDAAKRVYDIMKQIMHREDCEEMAQMHKTDIPSQHKQANKVRAQINKLVLIDRFGPSCYDCN